MKYYYAIAILCFSLALTSCTAHLSKEQCLATNWQQVGYNDGSAGKAAKSLAQETTDCQKFRINVDAQAYQQGWIAGLHQYCAPNFEQGRMDGSNGEPYSTAQMRAGRCQGAGLALNLNQYRRGYQQGIQSFCTYDTGFTIGLQGNQPPEVCEGRLKQRYIAGWTEGARQFCANTANAFALGKEGKPYPTACTPSAYLAFKSEYDRGAALKSSLTNLQQQISDIDNTISSLAMQYDLNKTYDVRGYELGRNKSPEAKHALRQIRELALRRDMLQGQLNQLQVTR